MRALACFCVFVACSSGKETRPGAEAGPPPRDAGKPSAAIDAAAPAAPAIAPRRAIDPASLESWGDGGAAADVVVHAAGVDSRLVGFAVADPIARPLLQRVDAGPAPMTGRFTARGREAAWKILATRAPAVAAMAPAFGRGRGRKVDLSFWGADTRDLVRLYADVLRVNAIFAAPPGPKLIISVKNSPVDAVLDATLEVAGLVKRRVGKTTLVIGAGAVELDAALLHIKGPKLDVATRAARASEVIAGIAALARAPAIAAPCGGGETLDLRMRAEPVGTVAATLALLGAVEIERAAPACPITAPRAPANDDAFVAVVRAGASAVAVFRGPDGEPMLLADGASIDGAGEVAIASGRIAVGAGNRQVERELWSGAEPRRGDRAGELVEHMTRGRLAATVIAPDRATAIFETPNGESFAVSTGGRGFEVRGAIELPWDVDPVAGVPFEIKPGEVVYTDSPIGAPPRRGSIKLAARP